MSRTYSQGVTQLAILECVCGKKFQMGTNSTIKACVIFIPEPTPTQCIGKVALVKSGGD